MKRISAILLLILFCVYSFTFKTHYCFHNDTHTRYHGDCQIHVKEAEKKSKLGEQNLFPAYYYCLDIVKTAQPTDLKVITIKNYSSDVLIIPPAIKVPLPDFSILDWNIPEVRCRSATPLLYNSLRAPPVC